MDRIVERASEREVNETKTIFVSIFFSSLAINYLPRKWARKEEEKRKMQGKRKSVWAALFGFGPLRAYWCKLTANEDWCNRKTDWDSETRIFRSRTRCRTSSDADGSFFPARCSIGVRSGAGVALSESEQHIFSLILNPRNHYFGKQWIKRSRRCRERTLLRTEHLSDNKQ